MHRPHWNMNCSGPGVIDNRARVVHDVPSVRIHGKEGANDHQAAQNQANFGHFWVFWGN